MDPASAFLLAVAAIAVAALWFAATRLRAKADVVYGAQYRTVAETAAAAQTEINTKLTTISERLRDLDQRMTEVERILKDAE